MQLRNFLRVTGFIFKNIRQIPSHLTEPPCYRPLNYRPICLSCRLSAKEVPSVEAPLDAEESLEEEDFSVTNKDDNPAVGDRTPVFDLSERTEDGQPIMWDRQVPRLLQTYKTIVSAPPRQVENPKYLRVSIIGAPNAGKSTLTNQILGWRVCSVSTKVHTTRRNTLAIMTEDNVQIVLVDTPGIINRDHAKKHRLERSLVVDPAASLSSVDVVAVLVDASNRYAKLSLAPQILHMLYNNPYMQYILILNKVDKIRKKAELLESSRLLTNGVVDSVPVPRFEPLERHLTKAQRFQLFQERNDGLREGRKKDPEEKFWEDVETYKNLESWDEKKRFIETKAGWPRFKDVFMISALDGDGVAELKNYFIRNAYSSEWRFNPSLVSNQSPKEIVLMAVREKLLDNLRLKLPYQIQLFLVQWEVNERGTLCLTVRLKCPRQGAMKHVVGENGKRIREIAYEAGQELMNTFRCEVLLKLVVGR